MPKPARRGGRYTTGIKRNSSGGYGGQTYGWRECLMPGMIVLGALMVAFSLTGLAVIQVISM